MAAEKKAEAAPSSTTLVRSDETRDTNSCTVQMQAALFRHSQQRNRHVSSHTVVALP